MIYDLDLLAVRLKVNKYEKNKVFFVSLIHLKFYFHPLSVLFDFLPPTLSSMVALYVICLLSHIACSAPLFHLGLLLHVDKQVFFFFFFCSGTDRVICNETFILVGSLNTELDTYCLNLPRSEGTQIF